MQEREFQLDYQGLTLSVATYIRKASEEWIICLHGLQSCKDIFSDLLEREFFEPYSVLAIDFIGFGDSDKPEDFSYAVEDQASIIKMIIEQINPEKIHLIGHSFGGMVSTLLLHDLQGKIQSFVNMEGNLVYRDCGKSKDVVKQPYEHFEKTLFGAIKSELARSDEPSAKQRTKWLEKIPPFAFYKTSQSIVDWSKSEEILEKFNRASQKRMFMFGDANRRKAEQIAETVHKAQISKAGHFMIIDNPEETYQQIIQFLAN